jgi:ferredoxin
MKLRKAIPICTIVFLLISIKAGAWDEDVIERFGPPGSRDGEFATMAPCVGADFSYMLGDLWFPQIYTIGICMYTGFYPGSSGNEQVFQAGPWAGGYVVGGEGGEPYTAIGTFDQLDFLMYDSVCSGFNVAQPGNSSMDLESTFDTGYSPQDLGMKVTLRYMMWEDPRLDDFILIRADLEFTKSVQHFWWGWMSDCDMGNNDLPDYYYDDLVGYDETRGVAYMYDDDGDPADESDKNSKLLSPTHIGQMLLSGPPPGGSITETPVTGVSWETVTWWDWNNDVTSGASAYDRLSQGTVKAPPDIPFDYRMMTAIGPYDVEAGDQTTFYFAMVFGEGLDASFWSRRARAGAEVSTLGSMMEHVDNLKTFFSNGFVMDDFAPNAPTLDEPLLTGREVALEWSSTSEEDDDFAGYRLYNSLVSSTGPWQLIRDFEGRPFVNSAADTVRIGFPSFYLVTAYDAAGNESTRGSAYTKTLDGVYATPLPSDFDGDCAGHCEEMCQECPDCFDECMRNCMEQAIAGALDGIIVSPNPYRGSADWERLDYEGRISFYNLPKRCTVYIYSMTGELVDVVYHNVSGDETPDPGGSETGGERWDMLTSNNQSIASGIYIYRVASREYGEKIGKFAVIKGER